MTRKFIISRTYRIEYYPCEEAIEWGDSESCEFSVTSEGPGTVSFFSSYSFLPHNKMFVGLTSDGIWFLDPELGRGFQLKMPATYDTILGEIEEIEDYDEEECILTAKMIELICRDYFGLCIPDKLPAANVPIRPEFPELPFEKDDSA